MAGPIRGAGRRELPKNFFGSFKRVSSENKPIVQQDKKDAIPNVEGASSDTDTTSDEGRKEARDGAQKKAQEYIKKNIPQRDRLAMLRGAQGFDDAFSKNKEKQEKITGKNERSAGAQVDPSEKKYRNSAAAYSGAVGGVRPIRRIEKTPQNEIDKTSADSQEEAVDASQEKIEETVDTLAQVKDVLLSLIQSDEINRTEGDFNTFLPAVDAAQSDSSSRTQKELGLSLSQIMFKKDVLAKLGMSREEVKAMADILRKS